MLLDVDHDGACVEDLDAAGDVGAVVLTPNRQHPTGATLSAPRRTRLLDWARANDAVVVEDDYDGEFRYDGRPISPLQGLAPDVVVYAGTASKTLAPGVRLGWLALPGALRAAVIAEKQHTDGLTGALDQMAFAELLRTNAYDRHIRRMRLRYRRRPTHWCQHLPPRTRGCASPATPPASTSSYPYRTPTSRPACSTPHGPPESESTASHTGGTTRPAGLQESSSDTPHPPNTTSVMPSTRSPGR